MNHSFITHKDITYSYYENSIEKYDSTIVFLSPGASTGESVEMYLEYFPKNIKIISPDLPGRGGSTYIEDNSLENLGKVMNQFVEALDIQNVTLIGVSFGGSVVHEMCRNKNYKKVYLIASGEYFTNVEKLIINSIFFLPTFFLPVQRLYVWFFINVFSPFMVLSLDSWIDARGLFKQWFEIVNYRLPVDKVMTTEASLVFLKNDHIVSDSSIKKLEHCYPNSTTTFLDVRHRLILTDKEKKELDTFFKNSL